ncbi:MAG: hypothetical protein SGI88_03750 [Candidatus Hydrogenedentes bacterium]|nr:hypothetical protein [Candidatus Hydrogenedentota bacterium]
MKNTNVKTIRGRRRTSLLLVDVINAFDFNGASKLLRHAKPMALRLAHLRA